MSLSYNLEKLFKRLMKLLIESIEFTNDVNNYVIVLNSLDLQKIFCTYSIDEFRLNVRQNKYSTFSVRFENNLLIQSKKKKITAFDIQRCFAQIDK